MTGPKGIPPEDQARAAIKASATTYRVTLLGATGSPIGHATMSACCEHSAVARVKDDFSARGLRIDAVAKKVKP